VDSIATLKMLLTLRFCTYRRVRVQELPIHRDGSSRAQCHNEGQRLEVQDPPASGGRHGSPQADTDGCRLPSVAWHHGLLSARYSALAKHIQCLLCSLILTMWED